MHVNHKTSTTKIKQQTETSVTFAPTVAFASVGGVTIVTGHAALAVYPCRQVPAVLAHAAVHTPAVAITLTRWKKHNQGYYRGATRLQLREDPGNKVYLDEGYNGFHR